jgi:LPS O-antigen subunit length determinant protein (WzzB/FepE family)
MHIELSEQQADALRDLLHGSLADLSSEIAATDNPEFRQGLRVRRAALEAIVAQL